MTQCLDTKVIIVSNGVYLIFNVRCSIPTNIRFTFEFAALLLSQSDLNVKTKRKRQGRLLDNDYTIERVALYIFTYLATARFLNLICGVSIGRSVGRSDERTI